MWRNVRHCPEIDKYKGLWKAPACQELWSGQKIHLDWSWVLVKSLMNTILLVKLSQVWFLYFCVNQKSLKDLWVIAIWKFTVVQGYDFIYLCLCMLFHIHFITQRFVLTCFSFCQGLIFLFVFLTKDQRMIVISWR